MKVHQVNQLKKSIVKQTFEVKAEVFCIIIMITSLNSIIIYLESAEEYV